jgi:3-oxoacyl-[acyl-carrier protein] reductase
MRLANKVAVVTGAASGFGEGIATRFAAEGAKVIVNDVNAAGGERVVRNIVAAGGNARLCAGDVSNDADVAAMIRCALDAFGDLDIVVNNAGTTHRNQPLLDVSEEEFDRI